MKKNYSFRLDPSLISELDKVEDNRTRGITNAIQLYLDKTANVLNNNADAIHILKDQLEFMKGQVTYLQHENSYLSKSWFVRLLLPKPKND